MKSKKAKVVFNVPFNDLPQYKQDAIVKSLSKFKKASGNETNCMEYRNRTKLRNPECAPQIMVLGVTSYVARFIAYKNNNLDFSNKNHYACHIGCDNPWCTNEHHIYLGTARTNRMDAINRGRDDAEGLRTFTTGRAKLNEDQVKEVRKLAKTHTNNQIQEHLNSFYGISLSIRSIAQAVHRHTYKCVK